MSMHSPAHPNVGHDVLTNEKIVRATPEFPRPMTYSNIEWLSAHTTRIHH